MKFCPKCGAQLPDEATFCSQCGYSAGADQNNNAQYQSQYGQPVQPTGLQTAAKVLMIIGTVIAASAIIPLAWCIPMTVSYCKKIKTGQPVSTGFKVCSLLFVSVIAGILMLCDNGND